MKDFIFRKADTYLGNQTKDLGSLLSKIQLLETLNQKIKSMMDPALAPYCQVANLSGSKLIFTAANGSVATQLRFQTADLLRKFNRDPALKNIHFIECKVRPAPSTRSARLSAEDVRNMSPLTPETAEIIREISDSLSDPTLKAVMLRIAERTNSGES